MTRRSRAPATSTSPTRSRRRSRCGRASARRRSRPSINPATGNPYTYKADGFEATRYTLATDQLGTQLDPPAHWAPEYPAIDELPPTFAVRPLVVISIVPQVRKDFNYSLKVADIRAWETSTARIPAGSVVFVRSDWSKRWPEPALAASSRSSPASRSTR